MKKKIVVIGASPNSTRYSYKAVSLLNQFNYPVEAIGIRKGKINLIDIQLDRPCFNDVHTVTLNVHLNFEYVGMDIFRIG